MANEFTIRASYQVRNGNLQFQSQPTGFTDGMSGQVGMTPGPLLVTTAGVDVDLSKLTVLGGRCLIFNYGASVGDTDREHRIDFGIHDTGTGRFWPLGTIYPGKEPALFCLSPELGWDEPGTGTGTGSAVGTLRLRANSGSCHAAVFAFDL